MVAGQFCRINAASGGRGSVQRAFLSGTATEPGDWHSHGPWCSTYGRIGMVMRQAGTLTALGIGLGLLGALSGARVIQSMCFGLTARDPLTFAGVVVLLAGVSLLASYVPVRRAMRVDPMVALRYE